VRHPALASYTALTLDELWVRPEPEAIAGRFVASSAERLELVLEDLLALPDEAPILAEGPQLFPDLVAPLVTSSQQALFVVARPSLQQRLVGNRGDSLSRASDPERARQNRLKRDELLSERVRKEAEAHSFTVVEVEHPEETEMAIERHFGATLREWLARGDLGNVSQRRREENEARLVQWRLHASELPEAAAGQLEFACECDTPACAEIVPITLEDAKAARTRGESFLAHPLR
jgi:hypothetical protein